MGLIDKISSVTIGVLNNMSNSMACKNTIHGINTLVKSATPVILDGVVKDVIHASSTKIDTEAINDLIRVKRAIAVFNDLDKREPHVNLVPFEIISLVNSITNEINKLLNEFGEDKICVDEFLITYFIRKFEVPKQYSRKVFEILTDNFAIENKTIRDAYNLYNDVFDFETFGAKLVNKNIDNIGDNIDKLYNNRMKEQAFDGGKKVRKFVK